MSTSTYYNEKKQCWVAQFSMTVNGERHRPSATGSTEKDAIQNLNEKKDKILKGGLPQKVKRITLSVAIDKLLENLEGTIEDTTYKDYCYRGAMWKKTSIATRRKMELLDKTDVQKAINQLATENGLCKSTCGKLIMFIRRVFEFAKEEKLIYENCIQKEGCIKMPSIASEIQDILPLSSNNCHIILQVLEASPRLKPIVYCMLYAGLRIGEVLALQWNKIDFSKNTIQITQAVKQYKTVDSSTEKNKYYYKIGPPKTKASIRTVPLSNNLKQCLEHWRLIQHAIAPDRTGQDLVFPKRNGKLQSYNSYGIGMRKFLEKQGIDPNIYHSRVFRHTYASYLVKSKIEPKTLQKILGHKDITTTLNYYVDTDTEQILEAAFKIDLTLNNLNTFTFENVKVVHTA